MWRAPEKTESQAAAPACGGGAWPGTPEPQAPPVWRAPEGPEGTGGLRTGPGCSARGRWRGLATAPVSGGGSWPGHTPAHQVPPVWRAPEGAEGLAAVPVGGGGAWPGFETTRRAKLAARTARGRAAAHGHTKQPGPTTHHAAPGTPVAPGTPAEPQTQTQTQTLTRQSGPEPFGSGPPSMLSGDQQRVTTVASARQVSSARPPCLPCRSSRR